MLRIFFDQNFNHRVLRGLIERIPNLDFVTTQILNKQEEVDPKLLELALAENRIIITHDINNFQNTLAKGSKKANGFQA